MIVPPTRFFLDSSIILLFVVGRVDVELMANMAGPKSLRSRAIIGYVMFYLKLVH